MRMTVQPIDKLLLQHHLRAVSEFIVTMGKPRDEVPSGSFSSKKETDLSPVDQCQGWINSCEFCDRRFGEWIDADEENLTKVPSKPGIFQMAFKSKNTTEIVSIILDNHDIQIVAYDTVDNAKELIADKKSKVTKTVIRCRWMIFKRSDDKDIVVLYAHWHNSGVLPKFLKSWPGLDVLQKTDSLTYSDKLQKWCYPKKDAFWKKSKPQPAKMVEVVKECKWSQPCEICDSYFSKWDRLDDVIADHKAPNFVGIFELAVRCGSKVDRVHIGYCFDTSFSIKKHVEGYRCYGLFLKKKEYANKNPYLQVRWIELRSTENDNSCFLYAHLLNSKLDPTYHSKEAEKILERNKHFICRNPDGKWSYVLDAFKQHKVTKFKQKKSILIDVEEEILYLNFADN